MKDIPLNVVVACTNGNCGTSSHVIINPLSQVITHIVVQNEKFPDSNKRLVSIEKIIDTTPKLIQLNCTQNELAEMAEFTATHYINSDRAEYSSFGLLTDNFDEFDPYIMWPYVYPESSTYSIPVEEERIPLREMAVHRGAVVLATDGNVGVVSEFIIDPTDGHITHLVLREGHLWNKKELTLPLSAIASMDEEVVNLNLDKKTVKSLPAVPIKRFYSKQSSS